MRIAAISDVHGNLTALDAVLADADGRSVGLVVNLGDLLSGALQPGETADRLMALGLPTVRGNHERQVLTTPFERMGASDRLAHDQITEEHRAWLTALPLTLQVANGVLAFHGSPTDDPTYLLDTVEQVGARPATEAEVLDRLGEAASWPLLLCGHTPAAGSAAAHRRAGRQPRQRRLSRLRRRRALPARDGGRLAARARCDRRRHHRLLAGGPACGGVRLGDRRLHRGGQRAPGGR